MLSCCKSDDIIDKSVISNCEEAMPKDEANINLDPISVYII